ncbi:MAG: hypothetical protein GX538_09990 [Gammaproteobacteria bacterium]|nr:hypothetical protein [Gammaproteobacteria bacterium]
MIGPRRVVVRWMLFLLLLAHGAAAGSGPQPCSRVLWRDGYGMRAADHELRVRIPESDMAAAADALGVHPPYRVRVTFALVEPGLAEVAQFAAMPLGERESSVDQVLDPSALEREAR